MGKMPEINILTQGDSLDSDGREKREKSNKPTIFDDSHGNHSSCERDLIISPPEDFESPSPRSWASPLLTCNGLYYVGGYVDPQLRLSGA